MLESHPEDCAVLCSLFSAGGLSELEFVSNPRDPFYTMYDWEDFAEVVDFLRYNGARVKLPSSMSRDTRRCFSVVDTGVGRFAICRTPTRKIIGIMSKK